MATLTITNLVISKTVVVRNDRFTVEFDLSHNNTRNMKYIGVMIDPVNTYAGYEIMSSSVWVTDNLAKNVTKHYQFTVVPGSSRDNELFKYLRNNNLRGVSNKDGNYLRFMISGTDTNEDVIRSYFYPDFAAVNDYCVPAVETFQLKRATNGQPDDEGESLLLTAKLGITDNTWLSNMACRLYYAQGATVDPSTASYIDLTSDISTLLTGVTDDATLVTGTYSRGDDYAFMLVFGDSCESASDTTTITVAFANFHLSGAAMGGAAFGKFSAADDTHPLFECQYPAVFYDDVSVAENGLFRWLTFTGTFSSSSTAVHSLNGTLTNPDYAALKAAGYRILAIGAFGSGSTGWFVRQISNDANGITMWLTYRTGDASKPSMNPWAWVCLVKMTP